MHERNISHSKAGMLQTHLGFAAKARHFLRIYGCPDPSASEDERSWQAFLDRVERRMTDKGVFERHKARAATRAEFHSNENRLSGTLRFDSRLLQTAHASALVWNEFFGSSLPQRLAREWMKRSCAVS